MMGLLSEHPGSGYKDGLPPVIPRSPDDPLQIEKALSVGGGDRGSMDSINGQQQDNQTVPPCPRPDTRGRGAG